MNKEKPYNELPLLPPAHVVETSRILKAAINAHKELAELKVAGHLIPNQKILIQSIALQEAKLSSEIENIVTTNDELYQAFTNESDKHSSHTKEVLNYHDSLWLGFNAITLHNRILNTFLFEEIASTITRTDVTVRKLSGTQLKNPLTNEIVYTPPDGEHRIRDLLSNLSEFIYTNKEIDSLIKLAILHYQFEAIHPFYDGNGRTGRVINILYLINEGLLEIPVLYLSKYIIENKHTYYKGLQKVTQEHDWESWILYILEAVAITASLTKDKIYKIKNLISSTIDKVKNELPRIYSRDLIDVLFQYPYCKISFLESAGIAKRQTASLYLHELERIGILQGIKKGKEIYYLNKEYYSILVE